LKNEFKPGAVQDPAPQAPTSISLHPNHIPSNDCSPDIQLSTQPLHTSSSTTKTRNTNRTDLH
jgi:hypothetical protein